MVAKNKAYKNNTQHMSTANTRRHDAFNKLITDCGVFFAFSDTQFKEGLEKANLADGEKLVSITGGGFMPSRNKQKYLDGSRAIHEAFARDMQDAKQREQHIRYELDNRETVVTGDITDALEALGEGFTRDEVQKVYNKMHYN